jgi:hypothetical protein
MAADATQEVTTADASHALHGIEGVEEASFTVTPF